MSHPWVLKEHWQKALFRTASPNTKRQKAVQSSYHPNQKAYSRGKRFGEIAFSATLAREIVLGCVGQVLAYLRKKKKLHKNYHDIIYESSDSYFWLRVYNALQSENQIYFLVGH